MFVIRMVCQGRNVTSQDRAVPGLPHSSVPSASTRARLLRAAADLIGAQGYDRASLGQLARRAGLTTGAVYSTFGSKWELLRALVAEQSRDLRLPERQGEPTAGTAQAETASMVTDATRLAELLHGHAEGERGRQLLVLQLEILLLGLRNPGLLDDVVAGVRAERTVLAQQLRERALAEGRDLPMPADGLATVLVAVAQGLQLTQMLDPDAVTGELYELAIQQVLGVPRSGKQA